MYLKNRTCGEYLTGLKSFIDAAEADQLKQGKSAISCPCVDCENDIQFSSSVHVHAHLIIRGFMDDYICWNMHGEEGCNVRDLEADRMHQETACNEQSGKFYACQDEEEVHSDNQAVGNDLSDDDLIQIGDNYVHVADQLEEMVRDAMGYDGHTILEFEKLKKLVTDMKTPLYPGCKGKYTKLFASLKLLQLKATHHMTDRGFKALLDLLRDMLPEGNEIPKTTYEAKQNICPLGLEVEKIHACKNDCILFRGDHANDTECPKCQSLDISEEMMVVMR